uniref:Hydroxylysine kinase n=1 Tax=Globodera pallida TaxID=36090 RepID=A0A183BJJ4_GLOPA
MQFQRRSPEDPNLVIRIGRTVNTDWIRVVGDLCRTLYGVQSAECTDLTGYDDLNFKLSKCVVKGKKVEDAFTFKFVNRWEEKFYPELCEAQAELAHLVANEGIKCPQNVKTLDGLLYFEILPELHGPDNFGTFADATRPTPVVLRTFVPGTPLGDWVSSSATATSLFVGRVDTFCNEIGTLLANFHNICDRHNFCPPIFHKYAPIMALEHWHFHRREFELQQRTDIIDANTAKLCAEVFEEFERKVMARKSEFEQGLIHGDFNESNILVSETADGDPKVSALIDFSDAHFSFRIIDIANAVLYLYLLWSNLLPSVGPTGLNHLATCLYRAYSASLGRHLSQNDVAELKLFVRARLVLSLVNGLRTQRLCGQDGLEYVLKTQKIGQKLLEARAEQMRRVINAIWASGGGGGNKKTSRCERPMHDDDHLRNLVAMTFYWLIFRR